MPELSSNDTLLQGFYWYYSDLSYDSTWDAFSGGSTQYVVGTDTFTIDDKEYFEVTRHVNPCNAAPYVWPFVHYIRKDLNDNKVYWRYESDTVETVLYDLNLELGSVVQNDLTEINMTIDSIGNIDYNGTSYPEYYGTVTLPNGMDVRVGISPLYLCSAGLRGLSDRNYPNPGPGGTHSRGGGAVKYGQSLATLSLNY